MLNGTAVDCQNHRRGQVVPPFGNLASTLLALPRLESSIPCIIENDRYGPRWAQIALLWLDAGYIEESDEGSPRELVQRAVGRWIGKQVEGINTFASFGVQLMPYPSDDGSSPGTHLGYGNKDWDNQWYFAIIGGYAADWVTLERRVTALETTYPGLGRTALHWFEDAAARLLPILTPHHARYLAERTWWYGMDDQASYEEEMGAFGEDGESEDGEPRGPDAFDKKFPDWMFNPGDASPALLDLDQLRQISDHGSTEEARAVARLVSTISQVDRDSFRMPSLFGESPVELENAYHLAYIRWNETDPMLALVDDIMNAANESGDCFTELLGADCVPLDEGGFQKWKTEIEAGFKVLKLLDELLPLISDSDE